MTTEDGSSRANNNALLGYVYALTQELRSCGHEIRARDLVDGLASSGLSLCEDEWGEAPTAYYDLLRHRKKLNQVFAPKFSNRFGGRGE
jgi:hypothetical protein